MSEYVKVSVYVPSSNIQLEDSFGNRVAHVVDLFDGSATVIYGDGFWKYEPEDVAVVCAIVTKGWLRANRPYIRRQLATFRDEWRQECVLWTVEAVDLFELV